MNKEQAQMNPQNKKGIYFHIATRGRMRQELAYLLVELTHQDKYFLKLDRFRNESPITFKRNMIVQDFLKDKQCDYLMMVDQDIIPPVNILDLADFDKDIIAPVMFAQRGNGLVPLVLEDNVIEKEDGTKKETFKVVEDLKDEPELLKIGAVGTGCIIIKREVLEAFQDDDKAPFTNEYDEKGNKSLGNDLAFCKRAREKGFEVWTHTGFVCGHWEDLDLKQYYQALSKYEDDVQIRKLKEQQQAKIHKGKQAKKQEMNL